MDAAVPHEPCDELDASVMAVEPHLAQEDSRPVGEVAAAIGFFDGSRWFGGRTHGLWSPSEVPEIHPGI
jgi:hypothetical protein